MIEDYVSWLLYGDAYDQEYARRPTLKGKLLVAFGVICVGILAGLMLMYMGVI